MKNLQLKAFQLGSNGILSREKMKTVLGGNMVAPRCKSECASGTTCSNGQTCGEVDCPGPGATEKYWIC